LMGPLEGLSGEQIVRQVETNMLGVIFTTQAFIPHFRAKGSGLFISTTSIGGLVAFPFSSIYHATKWGIEGWSESMAFELKPFGIGIKTVSPGYILTDFAGRSLDLGRSEAYDGLLDKMMGIFSDAENSGSYSTAEQVADVVYEAATDGRDKLRYVAGKDAQALYTQRLELGDEAFRKGMAEQFFG
jgi:NAD(P)-dependent dehydrogenase (short-subunit alcohol dehydrogenase family)